MDDFQTVTDKEGKSIRMDPENMGPYEFVVGRDSDMYIKVPLGNLSFPEILKSAISYEGRRVTVTVIGTDWVIYCG